MKKSFVLSAACAALLLVGCNAPEEAVPAGSTDNAVICASAPETVSRTFIDGIDVKWSEGDEIGVLNAGEWTKKTYTLSDGAGTASGTFRSSDGAAEGPILAVYPASFGSVVSTTYYVTYPELQVYAENNIAPNTLPMFAYGEDRSALHFKHMAGVLRLEVYTDELVPVGIDRVTVTSGSVICGDHYFAQSSPGYFSGKTASNTSSKKVMYDAGGVTLSTDPANPTVFHIVVAATTIEDLAIVLESTDGRQFIQKKTSPLTVGNGDLVKFPAFKCDFLSADNLLVNIDGEGWQGWPESLNVPSASIAVKTQNGFVFTQKRLEEIAAAVASAPDNGSISVDLSEAAYESETFPNVFMRNNKLKGISLPTNITTIPLQAFYMCSYLTDYRMHDGITDIRDQAFNYTRINPLYISKTVTKIGYFILRGVAYGDIAYDVDPENAVYKSIDGVLFSKDGKTLYDYPEGNGLTSYTVPEGVETLAQYSIMEATSLTELRLPSSLKTVRSSSFQNMSFVHTIYCDAVTPPVLGQLSYRPTTTDNTMNPGFKVDAQTQKVIYVPEGTKAAYETAWEQMTVAGWVFDDGSQPQGASASIGNLTENNDYRDMADFWK